MSENLAKKFTASELIKFAFPSIIMMMFLSMYTIVDGFFVAQFVGTLGLSAVNIAYPLGGVFVAIGVMLATGGSAVVVTQMGRGKKEESNGDFTLIILFGVIVTLIIAVLMLIFIDDLLIILGATPELLPLCKEYIVILILFAPMSVLQIMFQSFFVTAYKPNLGLILTVIAGVVNIVLDYIFIKIFSMGLAGAALATGIGYCIPAICGMIFFVKNKSGLCFSKVSKSVKVIKSACYNGSSEMVTNFSASLITMLYNLLTLHFYGVSGVAAITVVLYAQFLLTALFLGFSIGVAPIISYHHGVGNREYLMKLRGICWKFIAVTSVLVFIVAYTSKSALALLFAKDDLPTRELMEYAMSIFSFSFFTVGANIFGSALFTAMSNGKVSAIISFVRAFVFIILGLIIMIAFFGADGLWLALPFAEVMTVFLVIIFLYQERKLNPIVEE